MAGTWSSPNPQGRDLFSHCKIQPYTTILFCGSVRSRQNPICWWESIFFDIIQQTMWLHLLFPSIWVLWTLSDQNPCDNLTRMRYSTFWLASLIDHYCWNRACSSSVFPLSHFALPPLQDAFSSFCPSPSTNSLEQAPGKGEYLALPFRLGELLDSIKP